MNHTTTNAPAAAASPQQTFGTEGMAAMDRPSRTTRFFMTIVAGAERLNLRHSKVGNPPVYNNATPACNRAPRPANACPQHCDSISAS